MLKQVILGFCCAAVLALSTAARAGTVYSTLGPGDSFDNGAGWSVYYLTSDNQNVAASFTPGADYVLTSIDIALFFGTSVLPFHLASDGGGVPGAIIESFSVDLTTAGGLVTLTSALNPILSAGTTYWIYTEANSANFVDSAWYINDQGRTGGVAFSFDEATTWKDFGNDPTVAFRVNGVRTNLIPEPASMISAIVGAACLGFVGLRRRARG